jgi:hypothetical protein
MSIKTDEMSETTQVLVRHLICRWQECVTDDGTASEAAGGWVRLMELAAEQGVMPLLHSACAGSMAVSQPIEAILRRSYHESRQRNAHTIRQLTRVLTLLNRNHIPVLLLKGAALIHTVYDDPALRPMVDFDLLIDREDVSRAVALLRMDGYSICDKEVHAGSIVDDENEIKLVSANSDDVPVELHWHLFDVPYYQHRMPLGWFWATAQPISVRGVPALVLGPEAQLFYLCCHLALHHRGKGLLWQHDIVAFLHHYQHELVWSVVLDKAEEFELILAVQTVLPALVSEWHAPIPVKQYALLMALCPHFIERHIFTLLMAERRPVLQRFWTDLIGLPDASSRLRFAARHIFPSPAYMKQRYTLDSPRLLPQVYLRRWLHGAFELLLRAE